MTYRAAMLQEVEKENKKQTNKQTNKHDISCSDVCKTGKGREKKDISCGDVCMICHPGQDDKSCDHCTYIVDLVAALSVTLQVSTLNEAGIIIN